MNHRLGLPSPQKQTHFTWGMKPHSILFGDLFKIILSTGKTNWTPFTVHRYMCLPFIVWTEIEFSKQKRNGNSVLFQNKLAYQIRLCSEKLILDRGFFHIAKNSIFSIPASEWYENTLYSMLCIFPKLIKPWKWKFRD